MWIITDQVCDDPRAVGWTSWDFKPAARSRLVHHFRLVFADGEIGYEGFCNADPDQPSAWENDDSIIEPLLNFGIGRSGCSRIQFRRAGEWREF